jgi:hypothetical protein
MSPTELIRLLVLRSISDDYENVDQIILRDVADWGARYGMSIERPDIALALAWLIEDGLAKAYLLSPFKPATELQGMPAIDHIEEDFETYFYITKKGAEFLRSHSPVWLFDDDCNPRPI